MMAATRQSARPFPPLVLDDASSLEAMAGAVMRLHNTLLTIGRCYTTDAAGDRAMLWSGKDKLDFLLRILKRIAARIPLETCSPGWNACAPYCNRALCT